jgi:hypothetical protein
MNKLILRIGAAAATAATWGLIVAPASLADTGCIITGNGTNSHNHCIVKVKRSTSGSTQINTANVKNSVNVLSNTGGNTADKNTGGSISVDSGNSDVTVTIKNNINSNSTGGTP